GVARSHAQHSGQELSERNNRTNLALIQVECGFGLRYTTAARLGKELCQKESSDKADQRGSEDQAQRRWRHPKQCVLNALDGQGKQHRRKTRDDRDDDRQGEKDLVLTEPQALDYAVVCHCSVTPYFFPISSSALCKGDDSPQICEVAVSDRWIRFRPVRNPSASLLNAFG